MPMKLGTCPRCNLMCDLDTHTVQVCEVRLRHWEATAFDTNPTMYQREVSPMDEAPDTWPGAESKEHGWPDVEKKEGRLASQVSVNGDLTVKLIDHMGGDDRVIQTAKVSTLGEEAASDYVELTNKERFIDFLMRNRHGSPFEHNAFTFFVKAPIAVFREFHRHRIGFSYNEESGRYKQLKPEFYVPFQSRPLRQEGKPGDYNYVFGTTDQHRRLVETLTESFADSYGRYLALLDDGVAKEVARGVLPVYIYSSMFVTCNARSIMNLLSLRTRHDDSKYPSFPMWEIEQVALQIGMLWAEKMPITASLFRKHGSVAP